jgi:hypothetical protein
MPWDKSRLFWDGATVSATGASTNSFNVGEGAELRIQLDVQGVGSGTSPTLDVKLQDSADGSSWGETGVAFTQITGTTTPTPEPQQREFKTKKGRPYVRLHGTIGGSSSPQFAGVYGRLGHWAGQPTDTATTHP